MSKVIFEEFRERINGRLKDISNSVEETESRLKVLERKVSSSILMKCIGNLPSN